MEFFFQEGKEMQVRVDGNIFTDLLQVFPVH